MSEEIANAIIEEAEVSAERERGRPIDHQWPDPEVIGPRDWHRHLPDAAAVIWASGPGRIKVNPNEDGA